MENQTPLDYLPTEKTIKPERRTIYLAIESLLYIVLFVSGAVSTMDLDAVSNVMVSITFILIIFNYVVPIVKLVRKEIKVGLFLLYLLRAFSMTFALLGVMLTLGDLPYANEMLTVGLILSWPFFIIVPNVEIRKYNAKSTQHLLVSLMGVGLIFGYFGVLCSIEALPYANEFLVIGLVCCIPILFALFALLLYAWRREEYHYLKYYLPQLVLMCYSNLNYLLK